MIVVRLAMQPIEDRQLGRRLAPDGLAVNHGRGRAQTERQAFMSLGATKAAAAGAGLATSGSALEVLRSSASQGALSKALVETQGQINVAGYQEQVAS